ncbi:MAG TPA: NADH-quinone oxidoreductase subunit C [Myxococcales bacterium]|jgi:NADH-quinone oxidoreductase subunit C|nr:NADH-quinone oxidoreductase subunit C [Myxococcales bacterium]
MPALTAEQVHQRLAAKFGDAIGPLSPPKKDQHFTIAPARLREVARFLKEDPELAFDFLQDLTATDHPKDGVIKVVYHFYSYKHRHLVEAKVHADRANPELDSLEPLWKAANWMEREVFDLFGVVFRDHPDLRRVLLPDDWVGYPLRKDYQEAGGYRDISNVRDNPLDLYLNLDRMVKAQQPAPAAAPAPAAPPKPAATEPPKGA